MKAHGWRGALDFRDAANTLHGVLIDYKEEEIYMQVWKVCGGGGGARRAEDRGGWSGLHAEWLQREGKKYVGVESVGGLRARQARGAVAERERICCVATIYTHVHSGNLAPFPHPWQVDPNETMLLVDYDEDDVDIKLAVLANPATANKGYDLTIRCGKRVICVTRGGFLDLCSACTSDVCKV